MVSGSMDQASLIDGHHVGNSTGRQTYIIPSIEEPDDIKMTDYVYEDLTSARQSVRETWLNKQISSFESQNGSHFYSEKEHYVEKLYKYLKKITKRWASWNHKSFGVIKSRQQIRDLLQWEKSRGLRHHSGHSRNRGNSSSSEQDLEGNPLESFEFYCECSRRLLDIFRQNIYKPLTDFFLSPNAATSLQDIPRDLEKCLQNWNALLKSTDIDERLFNKESEKEIFINGLRNRTNEFDLVLRMVPDLFEKHLEALKLARRWKLICKASDIKRRGTFTLPVLTSAKLLKRREEIQQRTKSQVTRNSFDSPQSSSDNDLLENQLDKATQKYNKVLNELEETKATCSLYEEEIAVYRQDHDKMKKDLNSMKITCKELNDRISDSRSSDSSVNDHVNSSKEYNKLLKKELESAKMKYCSQRIKLLNAKKCVENLNGQLTQSQKKCEKIENEMKDTREKCGKLEDQLRISRKNLQTQGGMIDALQHQCKTLYDELEKTTGRCKSMEEDLNQSKKRCTELENDVKRRRSREEVLLSENTYLRNTCKKGKDKDQSTKKECMFPEIDHHGRSS